MYKQEIEVYRKHQHLKLAAEELGIPLPTLYWRLQKAGEPVIGNKSKYGSIKDKIGAYGESIFQKMIPHAKNQNKVAFQSKFDFLVNDHKVDVKSSMLRFSNKKAKTRRWAFSMKRQESTADYIICLGFDDNKSLTKILFIPGGIIRFYSTISLSESGGKWNDYTISEGDLIEFFNLDK